VVLIEAIVAIGILAIITGMVIQSMTGMLKASSDIRQSFESSLLLDDLFFSLKNDIDKDEVKPYRRGRMRSGFDRRTIFSYEVTSKPLAQTENRFGKKSTYRNFDLKVERQDKKDFLLGQIILREKL